VRLVLMAIGRKLVAAGRLDQPDDVHVPALQRAADADRRRIAIDARGRSPSAAPSGRRPQVTPRDWVGTVTPSQLAFPYLVNWGYPERFHRRQSADRTRSRASPVAGRRRGDRSRRATVDEFDEVRDGDILVCQMTNPAWVVLFTKIARLVTDTGGRPRIRPCCRASSGIPAVIGTSRATHRISTGDRIRVDGTNGVVEILA
jgi:pyruvate,water dikinase